MKTGLGCCRQIWFPAVAEGPVPSSQAWKSPGGCACMDGIPRIAAGCVRLCLSPSCPTLHTPALPAPRGCEEGGGKAQPMARTPGGDGDWELHQDTLVWYKTELSAAFICRASSRADPVPLISITHNSTAKLLNFPWEFYFGFHPTVHMLSGQNLLKNSPRQLT